MIHEVAESMFSLPLENYTLTFDDGLYTQYKFFDRLQNINTEKIFFISSNIICTGKQSTEFITCRDAHNKVAAFGNRENYMTLEQINELLRDPLTSIGGHSHDHVNLADLTLSTKITQIKIDTTRMMHWFKENLGLVPTKFCYPFNYDCNGIYTAILKQHGFTEFYDSTRIDVQTLYENLDIMSV